MRLELTQKLQQHQVLVPQLILSMNVLPMTSQELQSRIEKEFSENPALEIGDDPPAGRKGPAVTSEAGPTGPSSSAPAGAGDGAFDRLSYFQSEGIGRYQDGGPRRRSYDSQNDKQEMLQNTEGRPPGLKDHLTQQLHLQGLESKIQEIGEEIIQNLDQRGYLASSAEEVYESVRGRSSRQEFDRALSAVRELEPSGVAAENLQGCLLQQLERDRQEYPVETEIILHHLEDLGRNKLPKIAKEMGKTMDEIKEAVEIITCLDPLPGRRFDDTPTIYVKPEILVEKNEGKLEVRVDNEWLPPLTVSDSCKKLLKESRGKTEVTDFLRGKIESAQWLIQAIQQRQRTLQDIARAIVEYQRDFMENGPERLRAMKMQTIADIVGVHISTISRAIKSKYMQTPWGLYELRYFFTGGVTREGGELESRRNIYRLIGEIIEKEDKSRPYSDTEIAKMLKDRGLDIARRTVTKYREQEKIPSSRARKAY